MGIPTFANFNFRKGSDRNTEAYIVNIGAATLYISYQTVIAIRYSVGDGTPCVRVENEWGPTTGRHMREMGVRDWDVVSEDEIARRIELAVMEVGLEIAGRRMGQDRDALDQTIDDALRLAA